MFFKKCLTVVLALGALAGSAAADDPLLTIEFEVDGPGPFDPDVTVTLDQDGTVKTDVDWAPDPPDQMVPSKLMPPDPETISEPCDLREHGPLTKLQGGTVVAGKFALYISSEWAESNKGITGLIGAVACYLGGERPGSSSYGGAGLSSGTGLLGNFSEEVVATVLDMLIAMYGPPQ